MEIVPGIHQIKVPMGIAGNPLGFINTYLIEGADGWTLIDTGWNGSGSFESLVSDLKKIWVGVEDIRLIIVTHAHPDHYGLAGRIKVLSGAEMAVHKDEKAFIDSRHLWTDALFDKLGVWLHRHGVPEGDLGNLQRASMGMVDLVIPAVPDRVLDGGETIATGKFDLEVLLTPGHAPGHICIYERSCGMLFSGDHILPETTPNIALHIRSKGDPLGDYLRSLKSMRRLDVRWVLPAHGEIFADIAGRIDELLEHHEDRMAAILGVIADGAKTAYHIASEVPWSILWENMRDVDRRMAVTEALAHLETLRIENRVRSFEENDRVFYELEAGHRFS